MSRENVVLLSTADWDNPFWTNKQHVAVELSRRDFRVLYIDSLGLRRPSLSSSDASRIWRRLVSGLKPPRHVREEVWVWSPILLPFHGLPWVRKINRLILTASLKLWMFKLNMRDAILWTYSPLSTELLDLKRWRSVVYHCVDEIKAMPGMPADTLMRAESALVQQADIVFVTSVTLEASRRALNPRTYYFPNVADFDHFSRALDESTLVPDDLATIPHPRIGFIGAISGYKVNFELLQEVAHAHPEWSLVLIGQVGEGDPWTDASVLRNLPNVHLIGPRPYAELPAYLKGFDVAILPNQLNEYTAAMFPMKFFEYMAAGRPVVSVDLPSLVDYAKTVRLAKSVAEFIEGIEDALAGHGVAQQQRIDLAREHTYSARTERMLALVTETQS
ncbi:MAG TPA: glycosyltransferase [Trinickia sp.]|jgi:glycosyltransferase involved in cell wall biosynthesis|uniref:glycosyltransferase n=1 Tax=Trinickia sp. TaxID=2571163 RepID=UPI002B51CEFF|nr:glycosyltransferase [Trinickia sp.]HTI18897.1 glycosyltransferase [Trinickia sp.]